MRFTSFKEDLSNFFFFCILMLNYEYLEKDDFSVSDTGGLEEKIRVVRIGVEPIVKIENCKL